MGSARDLTADPVRRPTGPSGGARATRTLAVAPRAAAEGSDPGVPVPGEGRYFLGSAETAGAPAEGIRAVGAPPGAGGNADAGSPSRRASAVGTISTVTR